MRNALTLFLGFALLSGCDSGPATGVLKGSITLDGQPVPDGLIRFVPADGKTQPEDCKIANGAYTVTMPVGEKKVEITWLKGSGQAVDTASQGTEKSVQMIPPKYNIQTTLTYTVVKGPQTKDFALTSK